MDSCVDKKTFKISSYFHNLVVSAIIKVASTIDDDLDIVCYKRDSSTKFQLKLK